MTTTMVTAEQREPRALGAVLPLAVEALQVVHIQVAQMPRRAAEVRAARRLPVGATPKEAPKLRAVARRAQMEPRWARPAQHKAALEALWLAVLVEPRSRSRLRQDVAAFPERQVQPVRRVPHQRRRRVALADRLLSAATAWSKVARPATTATS
jgi:hypothetical protein